MKTIVLLVLKEPIRANRAEYLLPIGLALNCSRKTMVNGKIVNQTLFLGCYAVYLMSLVAAFWIPIALFYGHPIVDQLANSSIILVLAALPPLYKHKLSLWLALPIAFLVGFSLFIGNPYVAFEMMDLKKAPFDVRLGFPVALYLMGGGWVFEHFLFKRSVVKL